MPENYRFPSTVYCQANSWKESSIRTEVKEAGPFANETFLINGKTMLTDAEGNIIANAKSGLDILEFFDNLNIRQLDLEIEHVLLGTRKLTLFRTMPRRAKTDEKNLDENTANDLLVAFNLDFLSAWQNLNARNSRSNIFSPPPTSNQANPSP